MNDHLTIEELSDYLHRALAPEDDARVFAHLSQCVPCTTVYQREAALSEALREYATIQERELPAGVSAAIWDAVALPQPTLTERLNTWLRPMVLVPVAAMALLALLFLPQLSHVFGPGPATKHMVSTRTGSPAPIDASFYIQDHAATNSTTPFADTTAMVSSSLTTPIVLTADETQ